MQNQMMIGGYSTHRAPKEALLMVFWVVALVGLGFLIGTARVTLPVESERILPAETTTEDWHGNVRRSR
ncbi:hypothetical protein [Loktanella sp. Alg231-35]|uniref:hypothetical protein n=1 Tax=Loktanella sp. Alg231-35 TaxID=1922220 RepID=UPI00131F12A2|nr:hypothetical protein [Loktanella sp. Alg231-35]